MNRCISAEPCDGSVIPHDRWFGLRASPHIRPHTPTYIPCDTWFVSHTPHHTHPNMSTYASCALHGNVARKSFLGLTVFNCFLVADLKVFFCYAGRSNLMVVSMLLINVSMMLWPTRRHVSWLGVQATSYIQCVGRCVRSMLGRWFQCCSMMCACNVDVFNVFPMFFNVSSMFHR